MYFRFAISISVFVNFYPVPVADVSTKADLFLSASSPIPPVSPTEATFSYSDDEFDEKK